MSVGIIILITILALVLILTNVGTLFYIYKIKKSSSDTSEKESPKVHEKESPKVHENDSQIVKFIKDNMSSVGDYCLGSRREYQFGPLITLLDDNKIKLMLSPDDIYNGKIISKNDTQIVAHFNVDIDVVDTDIIIQGQKVNTTTAPDLDKVQMTFTLENDKLYLKDNSMFEAKKKELAILCK